MNFTIFWQYSIAAITLSESMVISPLALTRSAPNAPNVAPQVWLASVLFWPQPKPIGYPALNMALRHLELRVVGPVLAGIRRRRLRGEPGLHVDAAELLEHADAPAGRQRRGTPADRHRHPVLVDHAEIFVGAAELAVLGNQPLHDVVHRIEAVGVLLHRPLVERVDIVSGPGLRLGGPGDDDDSRDRKSSCTSTLFFSAQASTSFFMAASPVGTQWSQSAKLSLPAAPAVRMCTSGRAVAAAPSFKALAARHMTRGFDIARISLRSRIRFGRCCNGRRGLARDRTPRRCP